MFVGTQELLVLPVQVRPEYRGVNSAEIAVFAEICFFTCK